MPKLSDYLTREEKCMKYFKQWGTIVAALVVLLGLPAVAQTSRASSSDQADQKIMQDVNKKLADHPSFKNVTAAVSDRIVTVNGSVDGYHNKVRLTDSVKDVDNVDAVRNKVTVNTQNIPDAQLREQLAEKLRYDRIDQGIIFNNLTLAVNNGHVAIGGQVRTDVDRASAVSIVENSKGVTGVTDNIKVLPTSIFDDQLRVQVAHAIYGSPVLQKYAIDPQAPIRIIVDNGHVTLDGVVNSKLDKQVADVQARSVPGVFSVKDNLMVASNMQK